MISIFVLGLVFSAMRIRWNTTASMIVHGSYVVLTVLGTQLFYAQFS